VPAAKRQRVPGAEGEQDDNGQLSDAAMLGGFDNYDEDDEMMGVGGGGGGGFDAFDDDDDDAAGGMFANNAAIVDDKSGLVASPLSNMFFCAFLMFITLCSHIYFLFIEPQKFKIGYATKARRVDVKLLKKSIWRELAPPVNDDDNDDDDEHHENTQTSIVFVPHVILFCNYRNE
jgi:hypothetical protein